MLSIGEDVRRAPDSVRRTELLASRVPELGELLGRRQRRDQVLVGLLRGLRELGREHCVGPQGDVGTHRGVSVDLLQCFLAFLRHRPVREDTGGARVLRALGDGHVDAGCVGGIEHHVDLHAGVEQTLHRRTGAVPHRHAAIGNCGIHDRRVGDRTSVLQRGQARDAFRRIIRRAARRAR